MSALFRRSKSEDAEETKAQKTEGSTAAAKKPKQKKRSKGNRDRIAYRILLRPHVTEKAGTLQSMNQYVFRVDSRAGKQEIAQAVKEQYGVMPTRVNTIRIPGKARRLGKTQGRVSGYKKAIITIPEGKTINIISQ